MRKGIANARTVSMTLRRYRLFMALMCHLVALVLLAVPASAAANHIHAELVPMASVAPGETATIAIHMTPEKGWHGYWKNPGDAGVGMTLEWSLPAGANAGEPQYPVPQTLVIQGLMNHVYEHDYAVLVPVAMPADARPGSRVPIRVNAQWLACTNEICVPESANLATEIAVRAPVPGQTPPPDNPKFRDGWLRAMPGVLDAPAKMAIGGKVVRLAIPLPASVELVAPHVFVAADKIVDYAAPQVFARKGDWLLVSIPRAAFDPRKAASIDGVLKLDESGNGACGHDLLQDEGARAARATDEEGDYL